MGNPYVCFCLSLFFKKFFQKILDRIFLLCYNNISYVTYVIIKRRIIMPPKPTVDKQKIILSAVQMLKDNGIDSINARDLAKRLGCSTNPLFRVYKNMQELKEDVIKEIDKTYINFMKERMTGDNLLVAQGIAYVEFARQEKHIFSALFMNKRIKNRSIEDVINAEWNRKTIENVREIVGCDIKQAEFIFLNVWIYSCGLAAQLISNDMKISPEAVEILTVSAFNSFSH